jgi:hypothetical protein
MTRRSAELTDEQLDELDELAHDCPICSACCLAECLALDCPIRKLLR